MASTAPPSLDQEDRASLDPYLLWAWDTRRVGLAGALPGEQETKVKFLLLVEAASPDVAGMEVPKAAYPPSARFFTGRVQVSELRRTVYSAAWRRTNVVRRIECGMPIASGVTLPPLFVDPGDLLGVEAGRRVIAFIDFGCPFAHPLFMDGAGNGRVKFLWDQGRQREGEWNDVYANTGTPRVVLFDYGAELRPDRLVPGLDEDRTYDDVGYANVMRLAASHGAHVMSVAAGWPDPLAGPDEARAERDEAGAADIIFVQLPERTVLDTSGGSMGVYVLDALRYIAMRTTRAAQVVVNLSFGTMAGPHDGTSLLERAIDDLIEEQNRLRRFNLVLPAGNAFNSGCHARMLVGDRPVAAPWVIQADDPTDSFLELWYPAGRQLEVSLMAPGGKEVVRGVRPGKWGGYPRGSGSRSIATIHHVKDAAGLRYGPRSNCALVSIAPTISPDSSRAEAPHGIWQVVVKLVDKLDDPVIVRAYIERDDPVLEDTWRGRQSHFLVEPQEDDQKQYPVSDTSFLPSKAGTINSFAHGTLTSVVGGARVVRQEQLVDHEGDRLAPYTAAGSSIEGRAAPDYSAPSDDSPVLTGRLAAGNRSGLSVRMNGTSVAAPQLARALINGWAVVHPGPRPIDPLQRARFGIGGLLWRPPTDT